MSPPTDPHDADRSILAYVAALTAVFAVFALGLFWLVQPSAAPNPGLAAYKPPPGISVPLTTSAETAMAMERSARHAAGENKATQAQADNKAGEEKPARVARNYVVRRVARVAPRPGFDPQRPNYPSSSPWGYAQNRWGYAQNRGFGSWF
jgi:hypothetical protein